MSPLFAVAIAILLDPIIIILGLLSGYFNRNMVVLAVCATIIAIVHEGILFAMQAGRVFSPGHLLIGIAAAFLWGLPTFMTKKGQEPKDL